MRPTRSNVASVLGMSDTFAAVIYHPAATGSETGSKPHLTRLQHARAVALTCSAPRALNPRCFVRHQV